MAKESKYKAKKTTVDGIEFDSKDEALYFLYLKQQVQAKLIADFSLQPVYILQPKFEKLGKKYQAITYTPDFLVYHLDGTVEAIDLKGFSTQQGNMRRKMFDSVHRDIKLTWVSRSIKHGNSDGWIEYDELQRARKKQKK
jgi:hypothetical protein